ncbi:hypothetical protein [Thiothrix subterranea]|uniref:hypothetical protein n=1 Tax=Thiothrix subterranea TaxID=2735563 RepID=UPI00280C104C|nr:hypothetical protein [Thiothrix subterranea]
MRDLNTILRDIQARADSLAIFAQHAAALDSTVSTRKSGYVENVIDTLRILDCLKVDLLDLVRAEQARTNTQAYTNLHGKCIVPPAWIGWRMGITGSATKTAARTITITAWTQAIIAPVPAIASALTPPAAQASKCGSIAICRR